ncbi:hypothetical protein BJ138DRAFT_1213676 [Hygrophoropsis aurantiaca]|uniref:Uncharacterized protein n=1 Tax=Hygrophoropsis aurantiaca TaxID=72124 RepID=A0ACB8A3F9_9AGAM|nr:hypothetical protein BJ138DRAFT_1213676 [Hygrophoropsis aurantiaca]
MFDVHTANVCDITGHTISKCRPHPDTVKRIITDAVKVRLEFLTDALPVGLIGICVNTSNSSPTDYDNWMTITEILDNIAVVMVTHCNRARPLRPPLQWVLQPPLQPPLQRGAL